MRLRTVSVKLPDWLIAEVERTARQLQVSRSDVIRMAVALFVRRYNKTGRVMIDE